MTSTVSSMTGFARAEGAHESWRWTWELKSVNSRSLEMRFRLPPGADALERILRAALKKRFQRGSIFTNLQLVSDVSVTGMRVNEDVLADAIAAAEKIHKQIDCAPSQAEGFLALRGVMEPADNEVDEAAREALHGAIAKSFDGAIDALADVRAEEGAAMAKVAAGQLSEIETLTEKAAETAGASLAGIRDRIAAQLSELLDAGAVPEDRLAQEAAMMAVKADVREELDRLNAHIKAARALLSRGGALGRELDFLTQEFNRETNTLCSKAQDINLKQTGLDLKKVIDQLREQVQNIE